LSPALFSPPRIPLAQRWGLWFGLAGCIALLGVRRPDAFLHPQFWAEDAYFFERNYTAGLPVIFQPYNGYLHLVPRLIALFSSLFDPLWTPACFVGLSLVLTLYVASRTFSPRFPFAFHPLCLLAVVLVPDCPDTLLNPTNLQSILVAALVLLLISRDPETPGQIIHDVVAILILGLTGPGVVLLAPLFTIRAWLRKSRWSAILALLAVACGAIQLGLILTHPLPPQSPEYIKPALALPVLGTRLTGSLFFGGSPPWEENHGLGIAVGAATVVGLVVLGLWPARLRTERIFLSACCLLMLGATLYRMRYALPETLHGGFGSRYFYAPQLIVLWLLIALLADPRRLVRTGGALLLVLALVTNVRRLEEPALVDQHWSEYVEKIRNHEFVIVPLSPDGWHMTLNEQKK
jgi:hypothetical protein